MPVFFPACNVNLQVRFDDTFSVDEGKDVRSVSQETTDAPQQPGKQTIRPLLLDRDRDTRRPKGVSGPTLENGRFLSDAAGANPLNIIANRIPVACSVDLPSFRQAGTFRMTLAYRDLPIDPRIVAAAGVEIYMGAVDPTNFATGMVRVEADGSRRSVLNTVTPAGQRREDLLLLVGVVDEWNVSHNAGGSHVELSGRDLRGRLLDSKVDSRMFGKINLKQPIHMVVRDVLQNHPEFKNCNVDADPKDWGVTLESQIPGPADKDGLTRVRQKADGSGQRTTPQGGDQMNFWDVVTKWCFLVGGIPYFVGDRIVIKHARSLYEQTAQDDDGTRRPGEVGPTLESGKFANELSTPFADGKRRTLPDGRQIGVRRIVFGRDVLEYTFNRKFTGVKVPTIKVVCLDTSSSKRGVGKLLTALSTDKLPGESQSQSSGQGSKRPGNKPLGHVVKKAANSHTPSGHPTEEVLVIPVEGIKDQARLIQIAKSLYEEIGRGELGGSVTTKNLSSFGTDPNDPEAANRDPDLVRLRPGDAVEIMVDLRSQSAGAPLTSSYTDSRRREFDEEVAEVASRLGGNEAARVIARAIVAQSRGGILQLQTFFRVGTARFSWQSGGISISFDYQNYIEARNSTEVARQPGKTTHTANVAGAQRSSRTANSFLAGLRK